MENWNPFGWLLLAGGFLLGLFVGGPQSGGSMWLAPYGVMLAGLTILTMNMIRTFWRATRRGKIIRTRLHE
jgi:hypothetical protein